MRTGEWVVQLEYAEYLGSWKLRTGEFLVQLEYAEQCVELEAENWRLCSTTLVRLELEAENWRLAFSVFIPARFFR